MLSGGPPDRAAAAAFLSLHLLLYPAATAFNSVYDRDQGPVGGMAAPPAVPRHLRALAIALAAAGALLALPAGGEFAILYGLILVWTAAYSHPRTRWKAGPWSSAAAILLGQGVIGFAAGWAAFAPLDPLDRDLLLGAAGAGLTALGLYPVTQVFQTAEDSGRGDRTLAVALGPARALRLGALCLGLAAMLSAWLIARRFGTLDASLVALGYGGLIVWQLRLAAGAQHLGGEPGYQRAMRLLNAGTAGFLLFLAVEWVWAA